MLSTLSSGFSSFVSWSCEINDDGDYNFNQLTQYFQVDINAIAGFLCNTIALLEEYRVPQTTAALLIGVPTLGFMMYKSYKKYQGEKAETLQSLLSSAIKSTLGPTASDMITTYISAAIGDELEAAAEAQLRALPDYDKLGEIARKLIKNNLMDNLVRYIKPQLEAKKQEITLLAKQRKKQKGGAPASEPTWVTGIKEVLKSLNDQEQDEVQADVVQAAPAQP